MQSSYIFGIYIDWCQYHYNAGVADGCKGMRRARKCGKKVREKFIFVREKSVKSQGISFQTKSGHPEG